jgi:hypothetical protein
MSKHVILKFEQSAEQMRGPVGRVVGFISGKAMVSLLDVADLSANPRSAKAGSVTADIIDSLAEAPDLFAFKTKGILIGAARYRILERQRYEVHFDDPSVEGILDGGHNCLAIGCYILQLAGLTQRDIKSIRTWEDLKEAWAENRERIGALDAELDFAVPTEFLMPADVDDVDTVEEFRTSLLDICAARNNNVQLTEETKADKKGFYDEIKALLPEELANRVEWKTNDGGDIKVRDIIALAWIPLSVLGLPDGLRVNPNQIYRNKAACVEAFIELMEHDDVSTPVDGGYLHELTNDRVKSAFKLLASLPKLYDQLYSDLPEAYNRAGGSFGRISAVRIFDASKVKEKNPKYLKKQPRTPFFGFPVNYTCPDGFIVPLLYGLKALIKSERGTLSWRVDPSLFLKQNLNDIAKSYKFALEMATFDPQKVGKNISAYDFAEAAVKAQLTKGQLAA